MSETQALSPNPGRTLLFRPGLLRRPLVEGNLDGGNGENSRVPPSLASGLNVWSMLCCSVDVSVHLQLCPPSATYRNLYPYSSVAFDHSAFQ